LVTSSDKVKAMRPQSAGSAAHPHPLPRDGTERGGIGYRETGNTAFEATDERELRRNARLQVVRAEKELLALRLGQTKENAYGLPLDLFDLDDADMCLATSKVGSDTGIRFLKSMSANSHIYRDLHTRKAQSRPARPASAGGATLGKSRRRVDSGWSSIPSDFNQ
jgi:hypothetical protein